MEARRRFRVEDTQHPRGQNPVVACHAVATANNQWWVGKWNVRAPVLLICAFPYWSVVAASPLAERASCSVLRVGRSGASAARGLPVADHSMVMRSTTPSTERVSTTKRVGGVMKDTGRESTNHQRTNRQAPPRSTCHCRPWSNPIHSRLCYLETDPRRQPLRRQKSLPTLTFAAQTLRHHSERERPRPRSRYKRLGQSSARNAHVSTCPTTRRSRKFRSASHTHSLAASRRRLPTTSATLDHAARGARSLRRYTDLTLRLLAVRSNLISKRHQDLIGRQRH